MNVILIPFFLAANVVVNDTSEWTYGPEYLYNLTYVCKWDPVGNTQMISAMKCRPKMAENSLLCILQNYTLIDSLENDNSTSEIKTEQRFEIKFNEQGVESVLIEPSSRWGIVDFIRKIAKQLNVSADMKRMIGMSHFMAISRENTSIGNCATTYRITHGKLPETLETHDVTAGADFQLVVLPIADARPDTTLTIEKFRTDCINTPPSYRNFPLGILKMERFFRKIYVDGMRGFETNAEMDTELRTEFLSFRISSLAQLSLDSIVPAQDPLPSISNGELIDLNTNNILGDIY